MDPRILQVKPATTFMGYSTALPFCSTHQPSDITFPNGVRVNANNFTIPNGNRITQMISGRLDTMRRNIPRPSGTIACGGTCKI